MQKISAQLWYEKDAVAIANFYVATFGDDSKVTSVSTLAGTPSGNVDTVTFTIWGREFGAIAAGPYFSLTPAFSVSAQCASEEEIDRIYAALKDGGEDLMPLGDYPWGAKYAWVKDRYGLSWQLNFAKDGSLPAERIAVSFMFTGANAGKAEEAIAFYSSLFPDSKTNFMAKYAEGESPVDAAGSVKHADFTLAGRSYMAIDSAHAHGFTFTEAFSLMIECDSQEEIDRYWAALSAHPESEQCGWLKDRYGVSWQVVPADLARMMVDGTPEQKKRVVETFMPMKKLDAAVIKAAFEGA